MWTVACAKKETKKKKKKERENENQRSDVSRGSY